MPHDPSDREHILNVPNTLCAIRLLGSFVLFYLVLSRNEPSFLYLFVFLVFTDWIDGKLAILLDQRTEFGAHLDSAADAALYTAMLFGIGWMKWDFVMANWPWLLLVTASYWLTSLAGLIKFRQIPSYHTYGAKVSAHLVFIAAVCLFAGWADWTFYVAVLAVTITNIEATLMTLILSQPKVDVRSLVHAVTVRHQVS